MKWRPSRALRQGACSAGMIAVVTAIVVVLNLIVGQLPSAVTELDLSSVQLYTVSDTSKDFLAGLDQDVEIVVLAEEGTVDERILKFLDRYAALSDHITVTETDPVAYPSALTAYDAEADNLVVLCADTGKQTVIPFTDILVYDAYYYYYYGELYYTQFDAEGQLTSAVDYVTGDTSAAVYQLTGHGESVLSATVSEAVEKNNIAVSGESINLLTGTIPEDCSLLIVNAPTSDLADDELAMLRDYLLSGGQLMILFATDDGALPNFEALLLEYGLETAEGFIADTERYYAQYGYYYLFPEYSEESSVTSALDSDEELTLIYMSRGFTQTDAARDTIAVTPLMTTSAAGVAVGTEQVAGTYVLGAVAEETTDSGAVSRLTVFGSATLLDENILTSFSNVHNLDVFLNAVTDGMEDVSNISIEAKSLEMEYNTIANSGALSLIFIVLIPIAVLAGGLIFWMRRRRR